MKSAPQRPIFVSVNIKQKYMKLILRLGLILLQDLFPSLQHQHSYMERQIQTLRNYVFRHL